MDFVDSVPLTPGGQLAWAATTSRPWVVLYRTRRKPQILTDPKIHFKEHEPWPTS